MQYIYTKNLIIKIICTWWNNTTTFSNTLPRSDNTHPPSSCINDLINASLENKPLSLFYNKTSLQNELSYCKEAFDISSFIVLIISYFSNFFWKITNTAPLIKISGNLSLPFHLLLYESKYLLPVSCQTKILIHNNSCHSFLLYSYTHEKHRNFYLHRFQSYILQFTLPLIILIFWITRATIEIGITNTTKPSAMPLYFLINILGLLLCTLAVSQVNHVF